jgi:hypothetical protein
MMARCCGIGLPSMRVGSFPGWIPPTTHNEQPKQRDKNAGDMII